MIERIAEATWQGDLKSGNGSMQTARGGFESPFTFASRFGDKVNVSPEDLVAAAHAGCFAMALSNELSSGGHVPERVHVQAKASLGPDPNGGFHIGSIDLDVDATVPGLDRDTFDAALDATLKGCPISKLYAGATFSVKAALHG